MPKLVTSKLVQRERPPQNRARCHKLYLNSLAYTPALARITGGPLVRLMIENLQATINNLDARKIYLFSGHEYTVDAVTKAHNVTFLKTPPFSSAFIHETHKDELGNVYVKVDLSSDYNVPHKRMD